ncbi:hypothetical protein BCR34DRAFT_492561 [Clohesyomyces aquaticus]|uniref:Uncharacterized protein n=1 Tax=Clohesyomyces aquaticus TaxID=1231657 RepID=A0A1Y1YYV3_9PLEO|nr:hypothetical protein BCR34DRAFT_492561 [Clohesyomyces aquaticus]
MPRLSVLGSLLSLASIGLAATPIPNIISFAVDGGLDSCTTDTAEFNSGGFISVNGFNIKVPQNLIAQFPATWVPFPKMCAGGVAGKGYEVSVTGNVVNGQAIAAQIQLAQYLLEAGQGYIETVDTADGSLKIRGGPTVRINDPNGVFSKGTTGNELFTADDANPSIIAFSGFPMCIPRGTSDPKCPSANRPGGTSFAAPQPLLMAPFLVGDYIEYSGIKNGGEIWAYAITAINVQITTTASDTVPNYIRLEDAIIGVFDNNANVELADSRFIGYLSSCNGASVTISAIDVDPCTGEETERSVGSATPRAGDPRCKWEFRAGTNTAGTYTREYRIKANNPVITTDNGLEAGQYVQPVTEWIQPEVAVPGAEPPPFAFSGIRGLVQGDYLDGKQFGPLSPFPGPTPPDPSKTCSPGDNTPANPNAAPTASAAAISAQRVGAQVLLKVSNTGTGIQDSDLTFAWTKTSPSSPTISIANAASPTATFTAPSVTAKTDFKFEVTLTLKSDTTKKSTATVTVTIDPSGADVVTVEAYTYDTRQGGTIAVTCQSNVVNGDVKRMNLIMVGNGGTTVQMTSAGSGKFTYGARSTKKPTSIQCQSFYDTAGTKPGSKSDVVTNTTARRRRRGELGLDMTSRAE